MESYIKYKHFDLVSTDGYIEKIDKKNLIATVIIKDISPFFLGFKNKKNIIFLFT